MGKNKKIATGLLKGATGCFALVGGIIINGSFKAISGGGIPSGQNNPVQEAKELSKYWFDEAKKDFDEARKEP